MTTHYVHYPSYWAAVVDLRCTWSVRRKKGRPPIPVLTMASSHEELVRVYAHYFGLSPYKTGPFWYAQATGDKLHALLLVLRPYTKFRRKQYEVWLALLEHIFAHRGHRHRPLPASVLSERDDLALRAAESDPFK